MRTMFHRTKHFALIVASAVTLAAGMAAPIASAQPNHGSASDEQCSEWLGWFNGDLQRFVYENSQGHTQLATDALGQAMHDLQLARDGGCGWAGRVMPPLTTTTGVRVTGPFTITTGTPATTGLAGLSPSSLTVR